jgi:hypothetical protein
MPATCCVDASEFHPLPAFGLVNAFWSGYLWLRFGRHGAAVSKTLGVAPLQN